MPSSATAANTMVKSITAKITAATEHLILPPRRITMEHIDDVHRGMWPTVTVPFFTVTVNAGIASIPYLSFTP